MQVCSDAMPPTMVSSFEYLFPVNNKWVTKFRIYDRNNINNQEYLNDVIFEYHFKYDASIKETDEAFAQSQPIHGDTLSLGDRMQRSKRERLALKSARLRQVMGVRRCLRKVVEIQSGDMRRTVEIHLRGDRKQ